MKSLKRISMKALALMLSMVLMFGAVPVYANDGLPEEVQYATGCIPDSWETIQANLLAPAEVSEFTELKPQAALPARIDLAGSFPIAGNQGGQGSCTAWATTYALKTHHEYYLQNWSLNDNRHIFSPAYVFNQLATSNSEGILISSALQLIQEQGVCSIASFPYNDQNWTTQPTQAQKNEAANYKIREWRTILGVDAMKTWLASGRGVVAPFYLYEDFYKVGSRLKSIYDTKGGADPGYHALCLVGYDDSLQAFKFLNSWGANWAQGGYGWISYNLMNDPDLWPANYRGAPGYVMLDTTNNPPPKITTTALADTMAGSHVSYALSATGAAPLTWSLTGGALPTGLTLNSRGEITGTPTTAGTFTFTIKAENPAGSDTKTFSVTIKGGNPTVTVTTTGLANLKVGQAVSGASVVYTVASGTHPSSLTTSQYSVSNLPPGLTAGAPVRTNNTTATVSITGTPTTYSANQRTLTFSNRISVVNSTGATILVTPTGTPIASAVAKGDGSPLSAAPSAQSTTLNSITVGALSLSVNTGQIVQYAISTSSTPTPTSGWQAGTTFNGLTQGATYYVHARSAENTNYNAGPVRVSTGIRTGDNPPVVTATTTGLTSLTVRQAVSGASVVFTVTNGTFPTSITASQFSVGNLPPGLTQGTVTRTNNTTVTVSVTGMPSAFNASERNISLSSSVSVVNSAGLTVQVTPSGSPKAGPVARGVGSALSSVPSEQSKTPNSVTVSTPPLSIATGQSVEFAINTSATTTPTSGWQDSTTFSGLSLGTYYVHARSKANTDYNAGAARASAGIFVGEIILTPSNLTATANVGAGVGGRAPITLHNTSNATMSVTLRGTSGSSNANDPALYSTAGVQLAYQNFNAFNFSYTVTLNAGASWKGFVGTGGDVARNYTVTSTWSGPPAIAVSTTGLTNLKVGQAVSGASVVYALTNGTYATPITASHFTVGGLPAGLTAETAVRTNDTTVTIPITGTPTTQNANAVTLTRSTSIPASNVVGATSAITPTGTITASAVAKGDGSPLNAAPTEQSKTSNSITVGALSLTVATGQSIEYAISTSATVTPASGWQTSTTFTGLSQGTTYYVHARSASNTNYNVGPVRVSGQIVLIVPPGIIVSTTGLTNLKFGQPVSNASVVFTVTNGTYATAITSTHFTIAGLPPGLAAGTPIRTSASTVTIPITGVPTAVGTTVLTVPASLPASSVTGATSAIPCNPRTFTITVAKGDGSPLNAAPTEQSKTSNSITVGALSLTVATGQSIEYVISTSATVTPASGWQTSTTFTGLSQGTTYYVHARSASNTNYNVGPVRVSGAIQVGGTQNIVLVQPDPTATANVGAGASGRVPIEVRNTSNATMSITITGTSGSSNATDPALFSTAGVRLAYQNFNSWNFTYTITLGAGASWHGLVGTGGDVARSYTVASTWSVDSAITVTATGLTNLKVGQAVNGASVVYTCTGGTYATPITASIFAVGNLPPGLTQGTAIRTNNTTVTVPITGTPTTYNASVRTITLPTSIPAANVVGKTSAITPTGTITASAVAKGDGCPVNTVPTVQSVTHNSITVNALTPAVATGQSVQYAINTSATTTPTSGWQAATTFTGLSQGTTYYVFARTAENTNYNAGPVRVSTGITTTTQSSVTTLTQSSPTATVNVGAGASGRVPIAVHNTSTTVISVTIQGAAGSSNATDPVLFNSAGTQIAYQNVHTFSFAYTITLNPGATWNGFVGTGGDVERSYNLSSTWSTMAVSATGLTNLRVGQAVSGASIAYTLVSGSYATTITPAHFTIGGLPAGLIAGTPVRTNNTTVTIPITGAPTAYYQHTTTLTRASSIPAANVTGATAAIVPTGSPATSAVAKGNGSPLNNVPTVQSTTTNSITVNAPTLSVATGQSIEYAISTSATVTPTSGWQTGTTFSNRIAGTYYVYARSASNANYDAGTARVSAAITITSAAIAVTTTGLTNLRVGQAVSGASVLYTLTGGTYATTISPANFTVSNLPPGLTAGTAVRSSNTVVTIPITGTPTTYNASTRTLTRASSIPAANVLSATAAIAPTGTITASVVAKGVGGAVSGVPIVQSKTINIVTVSAVTNTGGTGQSVQYAISTSTTTPSSGWQAGVAFSNLSPGTYYAHARTAENTNYLAGTARVSAAITMGTLPPPTPILLTPSSITATANVGEGASGRVPIEVRNTSSTTMDVTLQGVPSTLTLGDPILYNSAGTSIVAYRNFNSKNFTYTITLGAGASWNGIIGTGGEVARSFMVSSTWSSSTSPAIAVTTTGLANLKVRQTVSGASIVYTITNGTYATTITPSNFTVGNLPAGLSAGTAVRTSNTVVTIPITGTPTAYNASAVTLTRASSIPAANATGAAAAITPTGTLTASAVARGDGSALSAVPTVQSSTANSVTVNALSLSVATGQAVEYAISTSNTATPTSGWQAGRTFSGLSPVTYYVYARSAANTNYNAGAVRVSAAIPMGIVFTPSNLTATANVGAGINGRVPITVWNTSTTAKTITLRGTAGTSNATDPALFNSAGTRIAYQNFSSWNFTYTITLGAGASWSGLVGTGGEVARSYTVTATFS